MQTAKSKSVEDVGLMEEKINEMGKELSDLKLRESTMREKLQAENTRLKEQLQEKETKLATMESLSMEVVQCKQPSKSYAILLKEKWLQF